MGAGFESALPEMVTSIGPYVVVGMAAVFAAAARAPMTSLFIVFELSGYALILPLMTAVALATALAQLLTRDTIYNVRLRRAGTQRERRARAERARERDRRDYDAHRYSNCRTNCVDPRPRQCDEPVARERGSGSRPTQSIPRTGQRHGLSRRPWNGVSWIGSLATSRLWPPSPCIPTTTLQHALSLLVEHDVRQLPVVDRGDETRLLGMLTQRDVLRELAQPTDRSGTQTAPTPVRRLAGGGRARAARGGGIGGHRFDRRGTCAAGSCCGHGHSPTGRGRDPARKRDAGSERPGGDPLRPRRRRAWCAPCS